MILMICHFLLFIDSILYKFNLYGLGHQQINRHNINNDITILMLNYKQMKAPKLYIDSLI
jgi:hypothetical protein